MNLWLENYIQDLSPLCMLIEERGFDPKSWIPTALDKRKYYFSFLQKVRSLKHVCTTYTCSSRISRILSQSEFFPSAFYIVVAIYMYFLEKRTDSRSFIIILRNLLGHGKQKPRAISIAPKIIYNFL